MAGIGRAELLDVLTRLREETRLDTPRSGFAEVAVDDSPKATTLVLGHEDEAFVRAMRRGLAALTAPAADEPIADPPVSAPTRMPDAALEAVELVLRGELSRGNFDLLPDLLPSFVFLVVIATAGRERALSLSRRAAELVIEAKAA